MGIKFLVGRVRPGIALIIGIALLQYFYPFRGGGYGGYLVAFLTGLFILVGALGVINPAWTTGHGHSGGGGADGGGGGGGGGGGE